MWSPKLNSAGRHIRPYDLMRVVSPGDVVFSYAEAQIKAVGVVQSCCYAYPKPSEFGPVGDYWSDAGWRVDVSFVQLSQPLVAKNHIDQLRPLLPSKHSPIQAATGRGNQSYLFEIGQALALTLAQLIDRWTLDLVRGNAVQESIVVDESQQRVSEWEDQIEQSISRDHSIDSTERSALVRARVGQGQFRKDLLRIERSCRVTGVDQIRHLVASHTKPWRECSNDERLDPENGFMLTPTIDHLFDRGFISFENDGNLIVSPVTHSDSLKKMGIDAVTRLNVGAFSEGQKRYLDWHRDSLFLVDECKLSEL